MSRSFAFKGGTALRGAVLALASYTAASGAFAPAAHAQGVPVTLAALYNVNGAYADGAAFSGGGLDGGGNAYSSTLLGTSITAGGVTLPLGPANQANVLTGQTVSVKAGKYATLVLLGTATNGAQTGQSFAVTYTDGTRRTFTQSLSDWGAAQGFAGEVTARAMSYRNTSSGGRDSRTFNLYAYTLALDVTRTVQSVTLPSNREVKVLALGFIQATPISLSSAFNRTGIYSDGRTFSATGGLDAHGRAYSASLLGTSLLVNGVPFNLGPANAANSVSAAGQTITLPATKASTVSILATGVNASQFSQPFLVTYTDGTTTNIIQSLSDWATPSNFGNETRAVTMTYRDTSTGGRETRAIYLYGYTFNIDATRQVRSIRMPSNANVQVLALTLGGGSSTGIIGDCGLGMNDGIDYVLVYQSSLSKWCVDASVWASSTNSGAIAQFFTYGDAVVTQLDTLFQFVPAQLPFVYQVGKSGISTGSDFGLGVHCVYDAFFNVLEDPTISSRPMPGFFGYLLTLHEAINDYTGLVAPGWPQDWWADHRSPFPNSIDVVAMQTIGTQLGNTNLQTIAQAQHERFGDPALPGYDPEVGMFDALASQFGGMAAYESGFNLIRGDGINWDLIGSQVTPLRSAYVIAYLQLGFRTTTDLTMSVFVADGVGSYGLPYNDDDGTFHAAYTMDPSVVRGVGNAHCSIVAARNAGRNVSTPLGNLRIGNYQAALATGGTQASCPAECRWNSTANQCVAKW